MKRLLMYSMVILLILFTVGTGIFTNTDGVDYDVREKLRSTIAYQATLVIKRFRI